MPELAAVEHCLWKPSSTFHTCEQPAEQDGAGEHLNWIRSKSTRPDQAHLSALMKLISAMARWLSYLGRVMVIGSGSWGLDGSKKNHLSLERKNAPSAGWERWSYSSAQHQWDHTQSIGSRSGSQCRSDTDILGKVQQGAKKMKRLANPADEEKQRELGPLSKEKRKLMGRGGFSK